VERHSAPSLEVSDIYVFRLKFWLTYGGTNAILTIICCKLHNKSVFRIVCVQNVPRMFVSAPRVFRNVLEEDSEVPDDLRYCSEAKEERKVVRRSYCGIWKILFVLVALNV